MAMWWKSLQLLATLILLFAVQGITGSWPFKNEMCTYSSKAACNAAAGGRVCVWCSGRGCRPVGHSGYLLDVCALAPLRRPSEAVACEDIASMDKCYSFDQCRWCTSTSVDDACFGFVEARRLPSQVFDCISRTLHESLLQTGAID